MCDIELAWAAGLFDGEGWVSINRHGLQIGVGQKIPDVLDRFERAVGVGTRYDERNNTFGSWRAINAADQYVVLRKLWPYLSEPKKRQAREALTELRQIRSGLRRTVRAVENIYDLMEEVFAA